MGEASVGEEGSREGGDRRQTGWRYAARGCILRRCSPPSLPLVSSPASTYNHDPPLYLIHLCSKRAYADKLSTFLCITCIGYYAYFVTCNWHAVCSASFIISCRFTPIPSSRQSTFLFVLSKSILVFFLRSCKVIRRLRYNIKFREIIPLLIQFFLLLGLCQ